ncbi:D-inositol 3-phosphate glycosyltransferase [Methylomusa anaerophila]|uniref:D-inositol 3-phosphate glycosyltransferase n=2 Tax=Methylomusa anaerophila TaxID=1930071 RepID=A0A348AKN2_9FIRM|nr:D-inositol 3-phosphate glycosyltransferase [Methylomusa anaerophila]
MKSLGIDARMWRHSGIGVYLRNLLPRVVNKLPEVWFVIMGDAGALALGGQLDRENVSLVNFSSPIYGLREQWELRRRLPRCLDGFWSPHYNFPLFFGGKRLVTVHDMCHLALKQFVPGFHRRYYARRMLTQVAKQADAIICVSTFTKEEFNKYVKVPHQRIYTVHNGVDEFFLASATAMQSPPVHYPYILYVGNVKPHKNLPTLLQAFVSLMGEIPHNLVVVGKKEGFIAEDQKVLNFAAGYGGRIVFTGEIDQETLKQYYLHAAMLVFPSLYEGFGLPPLEAMACGCPVIASQAASLPEVCGQSAIYFNPFAPAELACKIKELLNDERRRQLLQGAGRKRAGQFSWDKSAARTVDVIKELLDIT